MGHFSGRICALLLLHIVILLPRAVDLLNAALELLDVRRLVREARTTLFAQLKAVGFLIVEFPVAWWEKWLHRALFRHLLVGQVLCLRRFDEIILTEVVCYVRCLFIGIVALFDIDAEVLAVWEGRLVIVIALLVIVEFVATLEELLTWWRILLVR